MMRFVGGAVSALALGLLLSSPVFSQSSDDPAVSNASQQRAAEPTLTSRASARAGEIGARTAHPDDLAAVRDYYSSNPDKALWIEDGTLSGRARALMAEISRADDWGLTASSFAMPAIGVDPLEDAEAKLTLAALKYARHARGGRMDPTQLTEAIDRSANLLSPAVVIGELAASAAPDEYLRKVHPQHPQFERLRELLLAVRAGKIETQPQPQPVAEEPPPTSRKGRKKPKKVAAPKLPPPLTAERILFNMEQWRWMPSDLGRLHVAVNIPEFQFRVMKDGKPIHAERVVVGAVDTQTPIFSKEMETVVFQPGWGVPPSIKVKQLLPGLLAGRDPVSARGYRMSYRGREVSAGSLDWRSVDIRKVSIVQPPGPGNALGMVKFLFPNKHDVYMHDTPAKSLFNANVRAFSHGCVRVRNPMRFAEIIFAETANWAPTRVASLARGRPENEVKVGGRIDVHMTYFTVVVDDDGKAHTYSDIYGHEPRVLGGLEGRISQVSRKPQDLNAVRSALVSRAPSRRAASARDDDRPRTRAASRQRTVAAARPVQVRSSGGGGFLSWFNN